MLQELIMSHPDYQHECSYLLLLQEVDCFPHILNLVDPEPAPANRSNLLPRENLQETDQQTTITKVSVKIINMVTSLEENHEYNL